MATPVEVPKLGNTVEECIVAKWRKQKGDTVSVGDVIAEIETDKTTFELPAPVDGTLLETFFDEGALVPVFTTLCVVGTPGESVELFRPGASQPLPVVAARLGAIEPVSPQPRSGAVSPRARRFAAEHGFDPGAVSGSGPGGRVLEEDLRRELSSTARVSGMREKIGRRMRESLASTAQYTLNASADARGLLALRARFKGVTDTNINDLVTFCVIEALLEMPQLNAEFIDGKIHAHAEVHIGFACDTPRGLLVPVVRNAHELTLDELALAMKDLAAKAVAGTIQPDDLSGATFTISNLGALGIESFTPLLNPPQVAILGVGTIELKPVRRQGQVEFIDAIGLSLTCDHQVIDGAPGARFLQIVKEKIERVE